MKPIIRKMIGDYGTDYSITSFMNENVKVHLAKRNVKNNFDIFSSPSR